MNLLNDIYYLRDYVSLYLKDKEEIFEFKYEEDDKIFYNIAIKRKIEKILNIEVNEDYYDLETAYGYGGLYTNSPDELFISKALEKYCKKCKEENIIAEFFRAHVFNDFPIKQKEFFDLNIYDRDVVFVDLEQSKEKRWEGYSSKIRNILRKCEKELSLEKSDNLEVFMSLYKETMDKNKANDFYYFDKNYYQKLLEKKQVELYLVKKDNIVISCAFFMFCEDFAHYHLSANNYEYRKYNANYFILDKAFDLARQKGNKNFILGGGTTSTPDDTLFRFKKKFSSETKPFYISGKVYNKEIYDKYVKLWEKQSKENIRYFLKYRLEL